MKINNKSQIMKPFFDNLDAEVSANVTMFKKNIEEGKFRFSPSGLKKLIDDPRNFFKDVVDGNYFAVKVKDSENLEYILSLINQTLKWII